MPIPAVIAAGALFAALGAAAERLASVWPAAQATRRPVGARTALIGLASGLAAAGVAARSAQPWWATAVYLILLGLLVLLAATDMEQRRLPHLLLDPLILLAAAFVPFNPAVEPLSAVIGAAAMVAVLGGLGLVVRGGVARGDLLLVVPIGFMLGIPGAFTALLAAALLSGAWSVGMLAMRRVGMRSYMAFGPFLVAGAVLALLVDGRVLGGA